MENIVTATINYNVPLLTQDAFGSLPVAVDRTISPDHRPKTAHDRTGCRALDSANDWHGPNGQARAFYPAAVWPSTAPCIAIAGNYLELWRT